MHSQNQYLIAETRLMSKETPQKMRVWPFTCQIITPETHIIASDHRYDTSVFT